MIGPAGDELDGGVLLSVCKYSECLFHYNVVCLDLEPNMSTGS